MAPTPKRNKLLQSIYLEPAQAEALERLRAASRIPKAVLLREAVDDLITKHSVVLMRAALKARKSGSKKRARPKPQ